MQYIFYANTARTKGCANSVLCHDTFIKCFGNKNLSKRSSIFFFLGKELEHATAHNIGNKTILRPVGNMGKIADYQFVLDTQ